MGPSVEGEEPAEKVAGHVGTAEEEGLIVGEEYGCGPWHKAKLKLSENSGGETKLQKS